MRSIPKTFLAVLFLCLFSIPSFLPAQERCDRKGLVILDADVYRQVPRFVTGSSWQGERLATLRSNTQVYICGEREAAFGFSTKTWVQIAYEGPGRKWQYGWIMKERLQIVSGRNNKNSSVSYALVPAAFAADAPASTAGGLDWKLDKPPLVPPQQNDAGPSPAAEPGSASLSELGQLYFPLFIAMVLGMAAKGVVDWLDSSDLALAKQHLRNAIVSILVSPIVFLGFLTAGQFSTSTQTFVVLCLLAFQNGFFWQTVLKRKA